MVNLTGDGRQGSGQHPQGLLYIHQGRTFIWTQEFLGRLELRRWLWFTPNRVPHLPRGGWWRSFLVLGGILEVRTETN